MTDLLRSKDVAEKVGYTVETVNEWCASGKLPATKHGVHWFIRQQDFEDMFDPFKSFRRPFPMTELEED